jgi:hypothetical protein
VLYAHCPIEQIVTARRMAKSGCGELGGRGGDSGRVIFSDAPKMPSGVPNAVSTHIFPFFTCPPVHLLEYSAYHDKSGSGDASLSTVCCSIATPSPQFIGSTRLARTPCLSTTSGCNASSTFIDLHVSDPPNVMLRALDSRTSPRKCRLFQRSATLLPRSNNTTN